MNKLALITAMSMAVVGDYINSDVVYNEPKKPHWKETQSEDEREEKLKKAQAKRDRKAKKK